MAPQQFDPLALLTKSQQLTLGVVRESWERLASITSGDGPMDEAMRQMWSLLTAMGDIAGASAQPLQDFIARQTELAEAMATLASTQGEMAKAMSVIAQRHVEAVEALERLTAPIAGLMDANPLPPKKPSD